ncbi:hypothetical protein BJ138DRAFT_1163179 [Hygrophoropsis aurantiaca]|uniref:Uncharacterized protein n=1 Tax=Hygrophoropsis aurantiaca TaxID=72124 RepID=A0ACB7ZY85_9AGAM|nr:hypothetical protein BJ138DRAFT_1163179 [Hygrophoropsis aurantiaca]
MPAGSQPPNQPTSSHILRDDFFDSDSVDLSPRAPARISSIPIAAVPLRSSIPGTAKAKTSPKVPSTSVHSPSNIFRHIGTRFRRDNHTTDAIEMQPPPPKIPKHSPLGKVALGKADPRLYMDESKDKKPGDDESEQEVLADVEVGCWDIFIVIIESCCLCRRESSDGE